MPTGCRNAIQRRCHDLRLRDAATRNLALDHLTRQNARRIDGAFCHPIPQMTEAQNRERHLFRRLADADKAARLPLPEPGIVAVPRQ